MSSIDREWDSAESLQLDRIEEAKESFVVRSQPLGNPLKIVVEPRPWLVDGLLIRRSVTALVAPGGTGKSVFALTLGCSLASGVDVLGLGLREKANVLLLSYEDDRSEVRRRYKAICVESKLEFKSHQVRLPDYRFDLFAQGSSGLVTTGFASGLIDNCKKHNIGLLVVDPLSAVNPADENNNSAMATLVHELDRIARTANCSVLLVHHTRKTGKDERIKGNVEATRGAKALTDSCRIVKTLSNMSVAEAKRRDIKAEDARHYVQLFDAKQNYQRFGSDERWFQISGVQDESGESVGVIKPVEISKQEYWTKTPESVALRIVETFGKGSHLFKDIKRPYADTYKVKLGTVNDHFSMVREDSTVEVVCQDKTYLLTKVKDGNHQRSPARFEISLVG